MNSKFKRLLACLLSLMMVVSLFPMSAITASAAEIDETSTVSESEVIEIRTWDDLKALDARVEGGDMLEGVTVKLMNDIDLYEMGADNEPVTFNPIGANQNYFKGTFDGQGFTIKNMYQSGWALGYDWDNYGTIGLFAYIWNATIKNLTIENAECLVEGGNVASIAGCAWGNCTFENITVKNSTFATYNNRAAGIVGYTGGGGTMTYKDITIDEDTVIAGLWGSFDSSLGGVVGSIQDPTKHVFENVTVACRLDAYNDVTASYKYYAYRMCGMLIGRLPVDGNNQPILDNVTIGENVKIDYSNTPDYTYAIIDGSWKRLEAGYAYGGVDMTRYPEAEVLYKPFNSMFGGQQYGSYGQDDHEEIEALGRVAAFDGEYFTSLENAVKAADGAKDDEGNAIPVKLMADYDQDIVISKSLKLDLNGYSFTGNVIADDDKMVSIEDGKYNTVAIKSQGTWGGIDWKLYEDGTLVIAPTAGTPVPDKNAPTKRTYEVGEWRETVIYNSKGEGIDIGGAPYDMKAVKKLIIKEGVTTIGSFTCQFPNLTGEVVIPSTVTYIGQEAFHKTSITKLTFAAGGNKGLCIANGAFKKTLITEVSFPGDREYIHIHHWAFGGSTKLESAYIPANVTKCWGGEHVDYFDNFNSQTNPSWTYTSSPFTGCTKMETITFENEAVRDLFFGSNRNSTAEDPIVAYAGLTGYNTFDKALAAALEDGETLGLAKNVTLKDQLVVPAGKTLTLNLNGKTLSQSKACTGSYEMILNKGTLTINGDGKISFTDTSAGDPNFGWGSYTIRNEGTLVVNGGTIEHKGAQAFATHMICAIFQYSGSTTINGGKISTPNYRSARLWKGDMTINGGTFDGQVWVQAVDNSAKLTVNGGTFEPNGQDASSVFVSNATYDVEFAVVGGTFNGKIGANDATKLAGVVTGGKFNEAAKNGTSACLIAETATFGELVDGYYTITNTVASVNGVGYSTLAEAWAAAQDGDTIKLLGNIAISEAIINTKKVTLDLNGKTITGTDNATGSFGLITNKGELIITGNGKITLVATNDRDWNAYSSVISNTVGGKLIVENGTIEHLGGTDMAYGIDNLTNGKNTYAETIINGGTIKSTYRAIRQFLNGVEAQNILTVNGGVVEGANKSIWVQDPSKNNNTGKITVAAGATLNGDVYLYATAGSAEWPVEVSIAASAVNGEVITGNMPNGYILEKKSGNWTVNEYIAKVGNKYYKTLQAAVDAANQYQSVVLLQDAEGPGVVINKKTTIDFAGFTYTVTGNAGFVINAPGVAIRLINGTLKAADGVDVLVENNSSLTIQKQTLSVTSGTALVVNGGTVNINMADINAADAVAFAVKGGRVVLYTSSSTTGKIEAAAKIGTNYFATLQQAINTVEEGKSITLLAPVVVNAGETLNLNKKVTISYTSSVAGEDMITNRGTVIVDGATLVYNNKDVTGSNVTVSTISCEPGSVLEVKSGVVKNNSKNNGAKGIYAYAIDLLTNGSLGDVTVTISGGEVISTNYMAIRQFNNGTACKNTLTVTGGYIYGAKRAIQIHMDNNAAYLAISGGKVETGKDGYALCLFPKAATNVAVTGGEFVGTIYSGTNGIISGGTFDAAVYEGYITESYKMVKVDGVYNVIFDETYGSIATIGDKKYNSFAAAWNDAQDGDTIVLQNNIVIDTETFTVADGKKITLDMNGYTITVADNATGNYELFYIYGEMVVTGKGTIELSATNNRGWNASSGIFHNRGGVLTIENGTFTHNGGSDMAFVVDNSGNWFGDAVTNINGGTLTSSYIAIRNRMEQNTHGASGKAILNVYGGKIDGTSRAIWAQAASTSTVAPATGEINVYGGEIGLIDTARSAGAVSMTTITGGTVASFKGESGELKVNGGTITGDITILFADGTEPVKTVVKSKVYYGAVAKMGSTYYATLADAIKKCTGAQAITLLRDIEGEGFVITGKTAIDFNGHTYTVTAPVAGTNVGVQINASGKAVRLINGTLKAAEGSGVEVLVESNSTLTIQKQTLVATSGKALVVTGGSASINLATINAENAVAFEVVAGKITVYSEGTSSVIKGEKLAKKSGTSYVAK